ncbi:hypothetical protein Angca_009777, partial [Angiostrongylus cantonensis]
KNVIVTVRCSVAELIHRSFLTPGETITAGKCCSQIIEMHRKLQRQRPALANRKGPILHNNTRPHVEELALQKLNELGYETLPHPPNSSDHSPTDYSFFKHLDNFLREKCFTNHDDAKNAFHEFIVSRTLNLFLVG